MKMKIDVKKWFDGETAFGKDNQCQVTKRTFNLQGLSSRKFTTDAGCMYAEFPGGIGDHTRFWFKDGKPFAITTEPYSVGEHEYGILQEECLKLGLTINRIEDKSEWNPEQCLWIEILKNK
jgi:hypothetical protein